MFKPFSNKTLLSILFILFVSCPALHAQHPALDGLDGYIESAMEQWGIPGLTVSVVMGDETVYMRGFGIKKLGGNDPVDEHTIFGIASVSKAFTATALGMLVDEGLIGWDDPLVNYLPGFALYDPYVTQNITIRDALTHRSGLGRMTGNRIQFMPNRERSEIIYRLRYLEPEAPFRERYVYSNVMYMVAGEVIPAVTGLSWESFVQTRIFGPLGMNDSNTSITQITEGMNAAWPHQEIEGELVAIPRRNFDNVGASASINSTAADMVKWMRFHLGEAGVYEGNRLLSAQTASELYRSVTATPSANREAPPSGYALGWTQTSYAGRTIYRHGGATDGFNTNFIIMPEENIGVFISTNTFSNFMSALGNEILDRLLGEPPMDWNGLFHAGYINSKGRVMQLRDEIHGSRIVGTGPTHGLKKYTGLYYDDLYDDLRIVMGEHGLELHFWGDETQIADLEHWHHDTFRAVWRNPAQREKFVHFQMGRDGQPAELHVTFALRPMLLQVGAYPTNYYRTVRYLRQHE